MPRSAPSASTVPLTQLAEVLHRATAPEPGSFLVTVDHGARDVAFGTWAVPPGIDHPADPLVGFLAPPAWDAIGLVSSGRIRPYEPEPPPRDVDADSGAPNRVRATVLAGRDGQVASILEREGDAIEVLDSPPEGWVPDALARSLGRSTPPPTDRLARWVETAWLDAVATKALAAPGRIRSWPDVARLHPLAPPGRALPGALLAVVAEAIDLESSWGRIRHLWAARPSPAPTAGPPGGLAVPIEQWFDDGSFSRWVQRYQPPAEALLPAALDSLPSDVGAELVDALVTVGPPVGAA